MPVEVNEPSPPWIRTEWSFTLGPPRQQASPARRREVQGAWSGRERQEGPECGARRPVDKGDSPGKPGAGEVRVGGVTSSC